MKDVGERWEEGIPHNEASVKLYDKIEAYDFKYGGGFFCFKSGGDGDNGEHLMYLLDMIFEDKDKSECKEIK